MPGPVSTLSLAAAIVAVASAIPSALDAAPAALRARLASYGHAALTRPAVRAAAAAAAPPSSYGVRVSPLDFGGDPTGARDSAPALQACVDYCVNYTTILEPLGHMVGDASFPGGKYIANAGGCTIDLGGGEFKLAAPVVVPEYVGNINVGHGSLVADDAAFPADAFLFVVGVAGSCRIPQGSCNLAINFDELFFDGRRVASALQINNVMGTTVTDSYFLNFSAYGVQINDGHEVMMQHVWLGETPFDYPFSETDLPKAIAVQINGNDHFMRDIIVFSSKIGVEVNGAADYISGTHVWFPDNQAIRFFPQGVMAFHVTGGQNRFDGCYIDGSRAVLEGSGLSGNIWTNGFECCAGFPGPHGIQLLGNSVGPGLTITGNLFRGGNIYSTNTSAAPVAVTGTRIEMNSFTGGAGGTRAAMALTQAGATSWSFDFCSRLVFPTISRVVSVVVSAASGFPVAVARPPVGCTVVVETSAPVTGTVSVEVDSSDIDKDYV